MEDSEGRSIRYLRLSITDRCNCRCQYCMPEAGVPMLTHSEICRYEEYAEMVRVLARMGVTKVRITGGEPLVRRGVVDLVRMLKAIPGINEVDLTTNACLLAPLAAPLREAGLDRLNISLDTLKPEVYRQITRTGELADALSGIGAAKEAGFSQLKLNCVLLGGVNDEEIPDLAHLAEDEEIVVRFIELMPIGPCVQWPHSRFISAETVLERVPELVPCGSDGVAGLYTAPGWKGKIGLIRPMSRRFCSGCTRIRITSDGKLKPCLHSSDEIALRGLSGAALEDAIRAGIALKPAHHEMGEGHASSSRRAMNEIGG